MVFDPGAFIVVYCLQGTFVRTSPYEQHCMADAFYFLWFCCLRISRQEHLVRSHPPKVLHLTAIPLRFMAADVLCRGRIVISLYRKKKGGNLTERKVPLTQKLFEVLPLRYDERDKSKPWVFWHRYWRIKKIVSRKGLTKIGRSL